jgi:hypothetical protein
MLSYRAKAGALGNDEISGFHAAQSCNKFWSKKTSQLPPHRGSRSRRN